MEERRAARVGTVGGLALLAGGTAIGSVAGGTHSVLTTVALGLLAVGMGHALLDETRRQARRVTGGWAAEDIVNAVLLGAWAVGTLAVALLPVTPLVRAVAGALTVAYALICGSFIRQRRRAVAARRAHAALTASPATEEQPGG